MPYFAFGFPELSRLTLSANTLQRSVKTSRFLSCPLRERWCNVKKHSVCWPRSSNWWTWKIRGSFNFSFSACASSEVNERGAYFVCCSTMFLCSSAGSAASASFCEMELYQIEILNWEINCIPFVRLPLVKDRLQPFGMLCRFGHDLWLSLHIVSRRHTHDCSSLPTETMLLVPLQACSSRYHSIEKTSQTRFRPLVSQKIVPPL